MLNDEFDFKDFVVQTNKPSANSNTNDAGNTDLDNTRRPARPAPARPDWKDGRNEDNDFNVYLSKY